MYRKLGTSERFVWLCDQVGSINFVIISHFSSSLDENVVRTALDLLPRIHPLLKTRIEVEEDGPVFTSENVPPIPLRVEVRRSDDHWHAEAESELNDSLPWSEGPLVRAVLLKSADVSDLLVTFCHAIGDGMSGSYFINDLFVLMEQIIENDISDIQPLPERPPLEDLLPEIVRGVRGSVRTAALLGKQLLNMAQRPKKLPMDCDPLTQDRRARIIHYIFNPEETAALVARCHEETTTVHGAICAAVLRAGAQQISETSGTGPLTINCLSAINLRPFFHPPLGNEMGYYISWTITPHRLDEKTEFWDLARDVSDSVHHSINKSDPLVFASLLDKITPKNVAPADFVKRASGIYSATILVTNLGHTEIPEKCGPFILQRIHFAGANKAFPEYFCIDAVTDRDTLIINFAYTEPALSSTRAVALTEETVRMLRTASHRETFPGK